MKRCVIVTVISLTAAFLLIATFALHANSADVLEKRLLSLAGEAPVDCGSVQVGQDPKPASECVERQLSAHQAFIVRYFLQGIDSVVAVGMAGTKSGNVFAVEYDSMGWDSHGLRKSAKLLDDNHNIVEPCPAPVRLRRTTSQRLSCLPVSPAARGNLMAPNAESY